MALLTFAVYVGSAIYTAGISGPNSIMEEFDVSMTTALVGLTVFVLGYGISPMIWAPLSEFPSIGRLPVCESIRSAALSRTIVLMDRYGNVVYLCRVAISDHLCQCTSSPSQGTMMFNGQNIHTLLAMRFLAGWFGGPALAIGGATMGDVRPFLFFSRISGLIISYSDLNTWHMRLESGDAEPFVDLFSDPSLVDSLSKPKDGPGPFGAYRLSSGTY